MLNRKRNMTTEVREKMRGGSQSVELTALLSEIPAGMRMFSVIRLVPGASIGYHVHENETELFYFMEGVGRVRDDDTIADVAAGDSMATGSGHGHAVENTGETDLTIVACIVKDPQ